jgi:hypothetical protein
MSREIRRQVVSSVLPWGRPSGLLAMLLVAGLLISPACRDRGTSTPPHASTGTPAPAAEPEPDPSTLASIERRLGAGPTPTWRDGVAALVLVDVSGSMADRVRDADGERTRKILVAQRATIDLLRAFDTYRRTHPRDEVVVGVYEFSARPNLPSAREIVPLGPPEPDAAAQQIRTMRARGGTPIGDALIEARLALDRTGLRRRHLLVVTDGENTDGVSPVDVARVMDRQDAERRAALYFVAFDIDAKVFDGVKEAGGLVLPARDARQLTATLDELLSDRILVEAPR